MGVFLRYLAAVVTVWLVITMPGHAADLGSWRPFANPTELITLGMSKAAVLLKAGPPQLTELSSSGIEALGLERTPVASVWTYISPGSTTSVATLTFSGDRLVTIDVELVQ